MGFEMKCKFCGCFCFVDVVMFIIAYICTFLEALLTVLTPYNPHCVFSIARAAFFHKLIFQCIFAKAFTYTDASLI